MVSHIHIYCGKGLYNTGVAVMLPYGVELELACSSEIKEKRKFKFKKNLDDLVYIPLSRSTNKANTSQIFYSLKNE